MTFNNSCTNALSRVYSKTIIKMTTMYSMCKGGKTTIS